MNVLERIKSAFASCEIEWVYFDCKGFWYILIRGGIWQMLYGRRQGIFKESNICDLNYLIIYNNTMIRSTHVNCLWSRSRCPIIYLTQTHYMWSITQRKEAVSTILKSLVWLGLRWIRTLDLSNSKRTLYHYTIEPV